MKALIASLFATLAVCRPAIAMDDGGRWDFRFGFPGANGVIIAATPFQGQLFVAGGFTSIGHARSRFVARWDGYEWWPADAGLENFSWTLTYIYGLAEWGGHLYAGGAFDQYSGNQAPALFRWNGTNWSAFGGVTGVVYSVTTAADGVYVAGAFKFANDTNTYGVARWNGADWETFDSRVSGGTVEFVAVKSPEVVITGGFTSLAGQAMGWYARWDGTNWNSIPDVGGGGITRAICFHQERLHMSSFFYDTNGSYAPRAARWDGASWTILGGAFNVLADHLISTGTNLFAAGQFTNSGTTALNKVAQWDGQAWLPTGDPNPPGTSDLDPVRLGLNQNGQVLALGYFETAQGQPAACIAAWDGKSWSALASDYTRGMFGGGSQVLTLLASGADVYAGGVFNSGGLTNLNRIGRLTESGWQPIGNGLTNNGTVLVRALAKQGTNLFVGGRFTVAGGKAITNLARWDGQDWWPVGNGVNADVYALAVLETNLCVGGDFTMTGGQAISNVACWNGAAWSALGSGLDRGARAFAVAGDKLYVGGAFTNAGGLTANGIALWDGANWQSLATGVAGTNRTVTAIAIRGSNVYVGGRFTSAGGIAANNIARWDGSGWTSLGVGAANGIQGSVVNAIAARDDVVYAGGNFTNAGGVITQCLARWDGTNWSGLGGGVELDLSAGPRVQALALTADSLYVGGNFWGAGGYGAAHLARWIDRPALNLHQPEASSPGQWTVRMSGVGGLHFALESSATMTNWTERASGKGASNHWEFTDPEPGSQRFYRGVTQP